MQKPVSSSKLFLDFVSYDGLAGALRERNPETFRLAKRSLGTKIGELDRGVATWWKSRPEETKRLTELLEITEEDLGIHKKESRQTFSFEEFFPALPPLDLRHERSWTISAAKTASTNQGEGYDGIDRWLKPANSMFCNLSGLEWLAISNELERDLLLGQIKAAQSFDVLSVENLTDASERLIDPTPFVISLLSQDAVEDLAILALRPRSAGLLIVAPQLPSIRGETAIDSCTHWEFLTAHSNDQRLLELTSKEMERWTWDRLPDWRNRLLSWIENHLNKHKTDTLFSAKGVKKWLERFDPQEQWITDPEDLLLLCQIAHSRSEKDFPKPDAPDAGKTLLLSLYGTTQSSIATRARELAVARWTQRNIPWKGELRLDEWASLEAPNLIAISNEDLESIARGTAKSRNENLERVKLKNERLNPDTLTSSGLITPKKSGSYSFKHKALVNLLIRDYLISAITSETADSWALACFDPDRRILIDAALDAIATKELAVASKRLEQQQPDTAESIGASEALFLAIGRRVIEGQESKIDPELTPLAEIVIDGLIHASGHRLPKPWSRPTKSPSDELNWISACWAWSFGLNPPPNQQPDLLFPGWSASATDAVHLLLDIERKARQGQTPENWQLLLACADLLLRKQDAPMDQPDSDTPLCVRTMQLIMAACGKWEAKADWWSGLLESRHAQEAFLKRMEQVGVTAAPRLWPSFAEFEATKDSMWTRLSTTRLWLLKSLEKNPETALSRLSAIAHAHYAKIPRTLPPSFRAPLLRIVASDPLKTFTLEELLSPKIRGRIISQFGPEASSSLRELLDDFFWGPEAAEYLWHWTADEAKDLLTHPDGLGQSALTNLLETCPSAHLLAEACAQPTGKDKPAPQALIDRAINLLPSSGHSAKEIVAIIQTKNQTTPCSITDRTPRPGT